MLSIQRNPKHGRSYPGYICLAFRIQLQQKLGAVNA